MIVGIILLACPLNLWATTQWQNLAPGLDYSVMRSPNLWGRIHAFKIKLKNNRLDLALAKDHDQSTTSVRRLAKKNGAMVAVNGGFFTKEKQPIGLRIKNGRIRSPLHGTSWWGVFFIRNNRAYVASQRGFKRSKRIRFAVQGGPRLIINNQIPKLKAGLDERTALGINPQGDIILLATQNAMLTTTQIAEIMNRPEQDNGFNCINALNLDGGESTQMYAAIGDFILDISGFSNVTDAVLVIPRTTDQDS